MKHCVGSYAKDVEEGRNDIYSLRDPQDKPKLTVGAHGTTLAQLKGFANGRCQAELREAAGAFARVFEKVADPDALGLVSLSRDVERAGFTSLPGVGVFHIQLGLPMEQRTQWERKLSGLVKENDKGSIECEWLLCSLAKTGLTRELSELLPRVDPKAKHSEALHLGARAGHKEVVEMLLPLSNPKANDSEALRGAAGGRYKEIVKMLAHRYCGDENTFHHLLKQAGMDSSGFQFLPLGTGSEVQPTAKSMVEKTMKTTKIKADCNVKPRGLCLSLKSHPSVMAVLLVGSGGSHSHRHSTG